MPGRLRKSEIVRASYGKPGLKQTKNTTIKANISLKTKEGMFETKLKRTQNGPQLSAEMREPRVKFELSDTSHVLAGTGKVGGGQHRPGRGIQRTARKYENRGNEAKEYLKTKDITFFNAANYARFVREFAAILLQEDESAAHFARTKSGFDTPGAMP